MAGTSLEGERGGSGEESATVAGSCGGGEGEELSTVAGSSSGGGGEGDEEVEVAAGQASATAIALAEGLMSTEPEAAPPRISEGGPSGDEDGEVLALIAAHASPQQLPLPPPGLLLSEDRPPTLQRGAPPPFKYPTSPSPVARHTSLHRCHPLPRGRTCRHWPARQRWWQGRLPRGAGRMAGQCGWRG